MDDRLCHTVSCPCRLVLRWRDSLTLVVVVRPVCFQGTARALYIEGQRSDVTAATF